MHMDEEKEGEADSFDETLSMESDKGDEDSSHKAFRTLHSCIFWFIISVFIVLEKHLILRV